MEEVNMNVLFRNINNYVFEPNTANFLSRFVPVFRPQKLCFFVPTPQLSIASSGMTLSSINTR